MTDSQKNGFVWSRIADDSGETIAETLVSVLISGLALLLMATAIGASVNMVTSTREHMNKYYEAEANMVNGASSGTSSSVTAKTTDEQPAEVPVWQSSGSPDGASVSVQVYSNPEAGISIYKKDAAGSVP